MAVRVRWARVMADGTVREVTRSALREAAAADLVAWGNAQRRAARTWAYYFRRGYVRRCSAAGLALAVAKDERAFAMFGWRSTPPTRRR